MSSCTLERSAETELDLYCLPLSSLLDDEYFATLPVITVRPRPTVCVENEDALYTSFEQAISERVTRISGPLGALPLAVHSHSLNTDALNLDTPTNSSHHQHFWQSRRRAITLACLGLSLLLAGFDLMGLLVMAR